MSDLLRVLSPSLPYLLVVYFTFCTDTLYKSACSVFAAKLSSTARGLLVWSATLQ